MFNCWLPFPTEVEDEVEEAAPGTKALIKDKMQRLADKLRRRKRVKKEDISGPILY
jgi:hypothetical protein